MKKILPLLSLLVLVACASRTEYQAYTEDEGGYRHKELEGNLQLVNFVGNKETEKSTALHFANFRAIHICVDKGFKYYHPLYVSGDIEKETVTRTYPGYYGMSPYYSGFGYPGTGFAGGFGTYGGFAGYGVGRRTYTDTIKYPEATVVFECANTVYAPEVEFQEVSRKELNFQTGDDKGGLKVVSIPAGSPNQASLQKDDVILKAAGERVLNAYNLIKLFSPQQQEVTVELMRNGKRMIKRIKATDVTNKIANHQREEIKETCDIEDFEHKLCE